MKVNKEQLDLMIRMIDDPNLTDKTRNTMDDWMSDYGATVNPDLTIRFGSPYALSMMLKRRDKEVVRCVLTSLGLYTPPEE